MDYVSNNCIKIEKDGKEIYLLGTAHVLADSKREVEEIIEQVNPDSVCVELCDSRYQSLKDKDRWKNLDIIKVIREGKGFLLFANMILSGYQKRIGVDLESAPGDEMIAAFLIAEEKGKQVVLADRDVNVTLNRAWRLSSIKDKGRILETLLESLFGSETVEKEEVDDLMKGGDMFNEMMDMFSEKLPKVKQVFIDERDQFIANKILSAPGKKIVAIIGKGHQKGIKSYIDNNQVYHPEIEITPKSGIFGKIFPWILAAVIITILILGFLKGSSIGLSMLWAWVIASGSCTAVFAILALAHPLTILGSFIAAPIKVIIPTTSAGILLAPLEAMLRKPKVIDFEKLNEDISTLKGFFKNRVTHILTVFVAVTIGAIIGHTIALIWIAKILATK